jgi:C4-dicarboxylate-specific signal transduction histidine kinase
LTNLLSNAIKFTQTGRVSLRVQIQDQQPDFSAPVLLHFAIQDTGPGIDPLEQDLIFQPFVRTKTGLASQQGTGLGLSISREFVRLMGGELSFNSSLGQGTTFFFQIPIGAANSGELAQPLDQPAPAPEPSAKSLLAALKTMPPDWIAQLEQASRMLDEELILQLLEQIPPSEALLSETLKDWVEQFRFDQLIDLTVIAQ